MRVRTRCRESGDQRTAGALCGTRAGRRRRARSEGAERAGAPRRESLLWRRPVARRGRGGGGRRPPGAPARARGGRGGAGPDPGRGRDARRPRTRAALAHGARTRAGRGPRAGRRPHRAARPAARVPLSAARQARRSARDRRAAAGPGAHRDPQEPAMTPAAAPGRGVSPMLPLSYLATATAAFVLAALAVPWLAPALAGHYYQPRVLALTHTVTLGWITLTIMGASYQIMPVVLGRPIWSERMARWQLGLMVVGIGGLVGHFFISEWSGLPWAAGLVALGVGLHLVNAVLSARGLAAWTFTARLVALAHVGVGLTALYGFALALDKVVRVLPGDLFANLHAHVHLALLGWVLPMVIGVAARIYPMLLRAREPAGWPGRVQLWGVGLGVPAVVVGILASRIVLVAGALAVAAAVLAHVVWVYGLVRGRQRAALDWGLLLVLSGALALVPAAVIGLALALDVLAGPRVALAYAALAFGAWASLTIAGMMFEIVPFLVWYRVYAARAGREPVPSLRDLGWPAAERFAWILLTTGSTALAGALAVGEVEWIRGAGVIVALGALAFGAALARVLHHLMPCASRPVGAATPRARTA